MASMPSVFDLWTLAGQSDAGMARWNDALELINDADTIAISGHTNPDGDALGSVLGLGIALRRHFPLKKVALLLADDASVPRVYRFLPAADKLIWASSYTEDPDLFISVDAPTLERLENSAGVARRAGKRLCIDHHPSREEFADVVVRDSTSAATAVLISNFLDTASIAIEPAIAMCLFCGLVTDTGRFQYQNANPEAFACAARLVDAGADPARVALEVYQSQRLEYLHLESVVLGRIRTVAGGRVAYSFATGRDLADCGVAHDECDGLIDVVRQVEGVEVCLFLKEGAIPGVIRGNLRSKGALDISQIAARHNGGGHAAAAGFSFRGTIREALSTILPELVELVGERPR